MARKGVYEKWLSGAKDAGLLDTGGRFSQRGTVFSSTKVLGRRTGIVKGFRVQLRRQGTGAGVQLTH